jgi:uncharacterized protein
MRFGLSEVAIQKICNVLSKFTAVETAILYGSRAKGNFRAGSDIDLTLKGDQIDFRTFCSIANQLDDLLLPQTADLSVYSDIQNQDLLDHISRVGVVFYDKNQNVAHV